MTWTRWSSVSHRFMSGIDDEAIAYTAESLKLLRAEIERRTERLKALPREVCPDKRVTREIAAKRRLKLWPIVCVIDEAQNLFSHDKYGKAAGDDATFIIKIGPAFGVVLILATQRPDSKSPADRREQQRRAAVLPEGDGPDRQRHGAGHVGVQERDPGHHVPARASTPGSATWSASPRRPQVVRTYYLDMAATEKVAARARALREAAGTLSGVALGEDTGVPQRDVLADVAAVLGGASGMHWQPLADQLAQRFPERWSEAAGDAVRAECAARGVPSVVVVMDGQRARGCRAADVEKAVSQP